MKVILDETGILKNLRRGALPAVGGVTIGGRRYRCRPPWQGPSIQS